MLLHTSGPHQPHATEPPGIEFVQNLEPCSSFSSGGRHCLLRHLMDKQIQIEAGAVARIVSRSKRLTDFSHRDTKTTLETKALSVPAERVFPPVVH